MFRVKTKETEWQEEFKKALEDMKRGIFSYEY